MKPFSDYKLPLVQAKGHNPFPPPIGVSGDGQINSANYLAGGVNFGVAVSKNLTPDAMGKPEGLTLEQFQIAIRTGHDPITMML